MAYPRQDGPQTMPDPYRIGPEARPSRNPLVRVGMSAAEMVFWLVVMALLAIGMIWMLIQVNR